MADLTLHEAAERLGVHYMTAYRYVRLGMLPAHKAGGTWRVASADVDALTRRDTVPARRRHVRWDERLADRLLAGDAGGAWSVVEAALTSGTTLEGLYLDVLTPAMWIVGEQWADGTVDVAHEHRATGIALRIVGRLGPRFVRRGRRRGTVILANPQGERHALALAVLGDLVRAEGFDVNDLGADVPHASLVVAAVASPDLVAIGLSVSSSASVPATRDAIHTLATVGVSVPVIVGGACGREVGMGTAVADGRELLAVLRGL